MHTSLLASHSTGAWAERTPAWAGRATLQEHGRNTGPAQSLASALCEQRNRALQLAAQHRQSPVNGRLSTGGAAARGTRSSLTRLGASAASTAPMATRFSTPCSSAVPPGKRATRRRRRGAHVDRPLVHAHGRERTVCPRGKRLRLVEERSRALQLPAQQRPKPQGFRRRSAGGAVAHVGGPRGSSARTCASAGSPAGLTEDAASVNAFTRSSSPRSAAVPPTAPSVAGTR